MLTEKEAIHLCLSAGIDEETAKKIISIADKSFYPEEIFLSLVKAYSGINYEKAFFDLLKCGKI
jgi:hypothetical protein